MMLETTNPTAGVDEDGFYLLAAFSNKDPEQVREMLWVLLHPDEIVSEVVERNDAHAVLKIRPEFPGL